MVNFGKTSELNSKTDFVFASVSDFTSRIGNLSNGRAYTCYCTSDFTNLITSGGSAGTARGFFSKNSNGTTDFLVIVMGNSNIMYSARLNNTGEGVTYNKTFSDDETLMDQLTAYSVPQMQDNDDINIDIWAVIVRRFGRIVNIQFNVQGSINTENKFVTLFTLNEGYRPVSNIQHNYISQVGKPMMLNITTSGELQIYCPNNTIRNNWLIRESMSFICAT